MTQPRRLRRRTGRGLGPLAAAWLAAAPALAQETCTADDPPPEPICSVARMLEAVNPPQTLDVIGNLNPSAFAGGANSELMPGQASMTLSGGVSTGGAACARHLAAHRSGGSDGVPGMDSGTADMLDDLMGDEVDVPMASGGTRRAVFEVFSPNVISFQGGGLGKPLSLRHGGVGGWPRNSGAYLVIALTDAGPGDLKAGGTYDARAVGSSGRGDPADLYSAWTGTIRPRPYPPPNTEKQRQEQASEKRMCHNLRRQFLDSMRQSSVRLDATIGSKVRDLDCDMDGVGQAGTRTQVGGGRLSGTVTIERITDRAVIGRFELSGSAHVERQRRSWSRRGPGRVDIDTERGEESLTISGRFAAPNMRNMGYVRPPLEIAQAPESAGSTTPELRLIDFRPRRNAKNLPWSDPGVRLTFNRPLDPASVRQGVVRLETKTIGGNMRAVPLNLRLGEAETIIAVPREKLRDGVHYRVTVAGGASGPRGGEGATLAVDHTFGFATMVDLDAGESVDGLPPFLEAVTGIQSNTFQVAIDTPLVGDKPTVIRTYANWAPDEAIDPAWQVTRFPATVRAKDAAVPDGPLLTPPAEGFVFRRPDMLTEYDTRNADHTADLYGWSPLHEEIDAVRIEVEPERDCAPPRVYAAEEPLEWSPIDQDLRIGYIFAKVGPWKDGIPAAMKAAGQHAARAAQRFTLQQFPVQKVSYESLGIIELQEDVHDRIASAFPNIEATDLPDLFRGEEEGLCPSESWTEEKLRVFNIVFDEGRSEARDILLKSVHDALRIAGVNPGYDATVVFMPYGWIQLLGAARRPEFEGGAAPRFMDRTIAMSLLDGGKAQPTIAELGTITHEVGHTFGLRHLPEDYDEAGSAAERCRIRLSTTNTRMRGIEGIRIAPDGSGGLNKSYHEGNAEHPHELVPLMHPRGRPKVRQFITRENYLELIETMELLALSP